MLVVVDWREFFCVSKGSGMLLLVLKLVLFVLTVMVKGTAVVGMWVRKDTFRRGRNVLVMMF